MNRITEITRADLFECIRSGVNQNQPIQRFDAYERQYWEDNCITVKMDVFGKMREIDFLDRVFDLKSLPSMDPRYQNSEDDIWQHTINNEDLQGAWYLEYEPFNLRDCSDEKLLGFLCEIFHPAIRDEREPWRAYLEAFNELLNPDGYEIYSIKKISGRDVYGWKRINHGSEFIKRQTDEVISIFNSQYINDQTSIMIENIEKHPTESIGKSKELLESCCKAILDELGVHYETRWDVAKLVKETCKVLHLSSEDIPDKVKAHQTIRKILGSLSAVSQGMAELRNAYGSGHGKSPNYKGLSARHAELSVGAAVTVVKFLWDTYEEKKL